MAKTGPAGPTIFQPPSGTEDNPPKYTFNNATTTRSGHSYEMDDTPNNERIRIQHRYGSYSEYQATGNLVHKIVGNGFEFIIQDKVVVVNGSCYVTINGDANMTVGGNAITNVQGNSKNITKGNAVLYCKGDMDITAEGSVDVKATDITLGAVNGVTVNTDLTVNGDILCNQSITAVGNLNAGMNVYGTLSLQTIGYLSVLGLAGVGGAITAGAAIAAGGIITAPIISTIAGISLGTHVHADAQGGVVGPPQSP